MMLDGEKLLKWFKNSSQSFSLKDCVVDAVPVVRCKDCMHYISISGWSEDKFCGRLGSYYGNTTPNDFCSYGWKKIEDKDDETDD